MEYGDKWRRTRLGPHTRDIPYAVSSVMNILNDQVDVHVETEDEHAIRFQDKIDEHNTSWQVGNTSRNAVDFETIDIIGGLHWDTTLQRRLVSGLVYVVTLDVLFLRQYTV